MSYVAKITKALRAGYLILHASTESTTLVSTKTGKIKTIKKDGV